MPEPEQDRPDPHAAKQAPPRTTPTRERLEELQARLDAARDDALSEESGDTASPERPAEQAPAWIDALPAAGLADVLEAQPAAGRRRLWRWIGDAALRGRVLTEVHRDVRTQLIAWSDEQALVEATVPLDLDALADIADDLPDPLLDRVIARMPQDRQRRFEMLRRYPHDSAGGLMDVDAVTMPRTLTVGEARERLRRDRADRGGLPPHLDAVVVVGADDDCFAGQVLLTDLATMEAGTPLDELFDAQRPAVPAQMPASEVARLFQDEDLVSAPVLDDGGRVLGRITVDDVVDLLRDEAERSVMAQSGLDEDEDTFAPAWRSARDRALWLGLNLGSALVAAVVIGRFEGAIDQLVALAVLMPVVASMGGVAGNQSLAVVIRGLALRQVRAGNRLVLMRKEVVVGLLNGLLWALVLGIVATMWFGRPALGAVAGVAIVANLLLGVTLGTLIPMALARLRVDPALAGGVVLVAATDALGFLLFLGLASAVLL